MAALYLPYPIIDVLELVVSRLAMGGIWYETGFNNKGFLLVEWQGTYHG